MPISWAAIRRQIIVGTRIEVLDHWRDHDPRFTGRPPYAGTVRTVAKAQQKAYMYRAAGGPVWGNLPPASEVTVHDDGSWTQWPDTNKACTFRIAGEV